MTDRGVLYIAMGDNFFDEACISAESLKSHNPNLKTCCITDEEREEEHFDEIKVKEPNKGSDKIYYLEESPFDRTLFLDTDTYICGDLDDVFEVLTQFDIALVHNPKRISSNRSQESQNSFRKIPDAFCEFNTGVIAYEKEKFLEVSDNLRKIYDYRLNNYDKVPMDQPVFRKVLYESDLRIATLPTEYNCRLYHGGILGKKLKVAHGRLRSVDGIGLSKKLDVKKAADRLNSFEGLRVFYYHKGKVKIKKRKESLFKLFKSSLEKYGVKETCIKAIKKLKELDYRLTDI